ncbi:MAG: AAA family ATPase [Cryomorphaceae bacterium]|nr:AAA family ATPase [Cryomorphaceae bacterium]|tara:strand:+ start:33 stop:986 length:954 start_codon:yes stop_codon:yes gene_type:complete
MSDKDKIDELVKCYGQLKSEISKVVVGQDDVIEQVCISVLSRAHCLLVGVPGLAKTLLVNTIAKTLGLTFNRIQFTPDLMPSDIIGSEILDENKSFKFIHGPIFSNVILADEINRTPPKTQSALLEAMQEGSVTASGNTYRLPNPFFVLATQNPIEQEGTYPLPEAQLDRFMFNIWVDYPSYEEELEIVKKTTSDETNKLDVILTADQITTYQDLIRRIPVADNVLEYAVSLVNKTRVKNEKATAITQKYITWGAGPRASQYLIVGAKCYAALRGKYSPDIEDVKAIAKPILRHRLVRNYRADAEGFSMDRIIEELL